MFLIRLSDLSFVIRLSDSSVVFVCLIRGEGVPLGRKQMEVSLLPGEGKNDADLERIQMNKNASKYAKTMEAPFLPGEGNNDADLERIPKTYTNTVHVYISAGPFRGHQAAKHSVQSLVPSPSSPFNHQLTVKFSTSSLQLAVCQSGIRI